MASTDELLNQAQSLTDAGKFDDALTLIMRVLKREPRHLGALIAAAMTHQAKGDHVRAVYHARRARETNDCPQTRMVLALALEQSGNVKDAFKELEKLLDGPTAFAPACCRYAGMLCEQGRADEAAARCRTWLTRWPADAQLRQALANALTRLGDARALVSSLREAVAAIPQWRTGAEWLASATNNVDSLAEIEVVACAKAHARLLPAAGSLPRRSGDGTARIGFLSPDLRTHSIVYFLRPLLEHLDKQRFKVFCYDIGGKPDATTAELRMLGNSWRNAARLSDEQLVMGIRSDNLDVLVDLAGLTRGSRPGVFALRAAPIQINFLGYANTSQLPGVDYRICDSFTDPPGSESLYSEKLVRLDPCFLCYRAPVDLPGIKPRRPANNIVFGSFNSLLKLTPRTLDIWAGVLKQIPGARLFLKAWGLECLAARDRIATQLSQRGIESSRLDFAPLTRGVSEHLDLYNNIDIALDSYPYHGTTTTCEAMIMGVPVISRIGEVHRARVGLTLLNAVGLQDLAATSDDGFVEKAVRLAADADRLTCLRSAGAEGLRQRLSSSTLCDENGYTRRFESVLSSI